jgi:hypothetical protein
LIDGIEANLGARPKEASADSGYLSEANLEILADRGISAYVATGKAKHPAEIKRKVGGPLTQAMRTKLKRAAWRSRYRLRKQIVEPVFGQIKQARGLVSAAWHRESEGRMGDDLHRPQPHQARKCPRPGRLNSLPSIKRREARHTWTGS